MAWNVRIPPAEYYEANDPILFQIAEEVFQQPLVSIDTETTGLTVWKDIPLFFSLSWGYRRLCLPAEALVYFTRSLQDPEKHWVLTNAKYDMHILANAGHPIKGKVLDIAVMHALLYEEKPHSLDFMAQEILGWQWKDLFKGWDRKKHPNVGDFLLDLFKNDPKKLIEYASNDAYGTMQIYEILKKELENTNIFSLYPERYATLWDYFYKIEVPFTRVLWKCERNGVLINAPYLSNISESVGAELKVIEREITRLVGRAINMNSPPQLRSYFFGELKLRPLGYTKGGKTGVRLPQVDWDFLEFYAPSVPVARLMLQYRDKAKLKGTYADGLPAHFDRHGRIHTRYNQDIARTGRLSSSEPNLQNVPNAERDEHLVRRAFMAPPGMTLICFDYSALEMRLLAAASLEPGMIEAFKKGLDPHSFNASKTFGIPYEDIVAAKKKDKKDLTDYDKRCRKARDDVKTTVGFGVLYGMKEKSLALRLGCTEEEASELIKQFMSRNPAIEQFMNEALDEARVTGCAYTILGRRRFLPEILSTNTGARSRAERQAGNLPIQGSAADVVKMAMILIDESNIEERLGCSMLLQIHDELVFQCPLETCDQAMEEIKMWMEHPLPTDLAVELSVSGGKAQTWDLAK